MSSIGIRTSELQLGTDQWSFQCAPVSGSVEAIEKTKGGLTLLSSESCIMNVGLVKAEKLLVKLPVYPLSWKWWTYKLFVVWYLDMVMTMVPRKKDLESRERIASRGSSLNLEKFRQPREPCINRSSWTSIPCNVPAPSRPLHHYQRFQLFRVKPNIPRDVISTPNLLI